MDEQGRRNRYDCYGMVVPLFQCAVSFPDGFDHLGTRHLHSCLRSQELPSSVHALPWLYELAIVGHVSFPAPYAFSFYSKICEPVCSEQNTIQAYKNSYYVAPA